MSIFYDFRWLSLGACALLAACAVGPDYHRPAVSLPDHFKEVGAHTAPADPLAPVWTLAQPADAQPREPWWKSFGDAQLNNLMDQVAQANASLAAALASYRQAQALEAQARAALFPTISANAGLTRAGTQVVAANGSIVPLTQTTDSLSASASWEVDLWGQVRRSVEAQHAQMQANQAQLESTRLSLQAQAATDYVGIRVADAQIALLQNTLLGYQKSLTITRNRLAQGTVTNADVAQAQTQLLSTQTQLSDAQLSRAQLEHALAILVGQAPASFTLTPRPQAACVAAPLEPVHEGRACDPLGLHLPEVPGVVPSILLQRRPDVAQAERVAAAANAQIGVAQAAYFPSLSLAASGGYHGLYRNDLFSLPNQIWSLGPALAATLFDGGARQAAKASAQASYEQDVALYRQAVLAAMGSVEDQFAAQRQLQIEDQTQTQAVTAALESLRITQNQYLAGTVDYLSVVTAQSTALTAQNSALTIQQRRFVAVINLIQALGGGWSGL